MRVEKRFADTRAVTAVMELAKQIGSFASEDELVDEDFSTTWPW